MAGGDPAGNGSLMRATAPYVAGYRGEALLAAAAVDSALTHPDPRCVAACVWYSATLEAAHMIDEPHRFADAVDRGLAALRQAPVFDWLESSASGVVRAWSTFTGRWAGARAEVSDRVRAALGGEFIDCLRTSWQKWPTGFVLDTLAQATWAATQGSTADESIRLAVLHGGRDADTIGAIAGGLVGARFGRRALEHWDATLLDELRLGYHWPDVRTDGPFVGLLEGLVADRSAEPS